MSSLLSEMLSIGRDEGSTTISCGIIFVGPSLRGFFSFFLCAFRVFFLSLVGAGPSVFFIISFVALSILSAVIT